MAILEQFVLPLALGALGGLVSHLLARRLWKAQTDHAAKQRLEERRREAAAAILDLLDEMERALGDSDEDHFSVEATALSVKVGNVAPRLEADLLAERIQDAAWSCGHSWIATRFGESPHAIARESLAEIRACCRSVLASKPIHEIAVPKARQAGLQAMFHDYYGE